VDVGNEDATETERRSHRRRCVHPYPSRQLRWAPMLRAGREPVV